MPAPIPERYRTNGKTKRCIKRERIFEIDGFYKRKGSFDGYRSDCKRCVSQRSRAWYANNSDKAKEQARRWLSENQEGARRRKSEYYEAVGREKAREYRQAMSSEQRYKYKEAQRRAKAADPEKYVRYELKRRARRYGMTIEDYELILNAQNGRCAICGGAPNGVGALHVDHDHVTNEVRGFLCHSCNTSLGHFRDDPAVLLKAIEYLANPPARERLRKARPSGSA